MAVRTPLPFKMKIKQIIGWYGVLAIITAFALLNFGILGTDNLVYQLLNLTGAIGIIIEAGAKNDYQPVALNIVWLLVATYGLLRTLL